MSSTNIDETHHHAANHGVGVQFTNPSRSQFTKTSRSCVLRSRRPLSLNAAHVLFQQFKRGTLVLRHWVPHSINPLYRPIYSITRHCHAILQGCRQLSRSKAMEQMCRERGYQRGYDSRDCGPKLVQLPADQGGEYVKRYVLYRSHEWSITASG